MEVRLLDDSRDPQGQGLLRLEGLDEPTRHGQWMEATLVAVSDGCLQWWLDHGEASGYGRGCAFHLCKGGKELPNGQK